MIRWRTPEFFRSWPGCLRGGDIPGEIDVRTYKATSRSSHAHSSLGAGRPFDTRRVRAPLQLNAGGEKGGTHRRSGPHAIARAITPSRCATYQSFDMARQLSGQHARY